METQIHLLETDILKSGAHLLQRSVVVSACKVAVEKICLRNGRAFQMRLFKLGFLTLVRSERTFTELLPPSAEEQKNPIHGPAGGSVGVV